MKFSVTRIVCIAITFLANYTFCLNQPVNSNPASPAGNAPPGSSLLPANEAKPAGVSTTNGQTGVASPTVNNENGLPAANNNPNGNDVKQNNNGVQTGAPNNLPSSGNNNGAANSNNGVTNKPGSPNNGVLLNGANSNPGNTLPGTVNGNGMNGPNSTGNNGTKPGVGNATDSHHPIGKSAKQTQTHAGQKGKSDVHRGQKNTGNSLNSGTGSTTLYILVATAILFLTKLAI